MTTDIRNQILKWKERLSGGSAGAFHAEAGDQPASAAAASATREPEARASDAEIRAALAEFGWKPKRQERAKPNEAAALEEPTAIISAVLAKTPGPETDGEALLEPTAVVSTRPGKSEHSAAAEPAAPEAMDVKDIFGKLNPDILKEVFTQEELQELGGGDETHIYKKAEEPARDPFDAAEPAPKPIWQPRKPKPAAEKAAEPEPEVEYTDRDFRPIRRKREYHTGLRGGLMYFGFVVCVSLALASIAWLAADDVLSLNKEEMEAQVYVGEDTDLDAVASELYGKGLIKYKSLFKLFGKLTHAEEKVEPGIYTLSTKLDYNAMIHTMHQDDVSFEERDTVTVTIPEGKTVKQTFQILAEHGVCAYETLLDCAANHEFKYGFLMELPYGEANRLEGYLFPDTYQFYASSTPEEAIDKFLSNFNNKVTDEMMMEAENLGYSFHEIVTIASLIEMEAGNDTERNTISSVIHNRLNSSYYPYLQIDATIQYALEERKEKLLDEDLAVDSPYNTYKYTGLPPGPIANPGLSSLRAALAPENTGYYFYALNQNGVHNFFTNLSDFNYFINSSDFGG